MENRNYSSISTPLEIPKIIITDYNAELADEQHNQQECSQSDHNNGGSLKPRTISANESEEEDREIIESLTRAHAVIKEVHIDVDPEPVVSTAITKENGKEKSTETSELKQEDPKDIECYRTDSATDDALADLEVSRITHLLESRKVFAPLPGSTRHSRRHVQRGLFDPMPKLPDVSDVVKPPHSVKLFDANTHFSNNHYSNGSSNGALKRSIPDIMTRGNIGAAAFGLEPSSNTTESLPTNGRRTAQLHNETDEQPPQYWKLYFCTSTDKSNGDENQATHSETDDNTTSSPKKILKTGSSSKSTDNKK